MQTKKLLSLFLAVIMVIGLVPFTVFADDTAGGSVSPVAKIGEAEYTSLASAFAAAQAGETITLVEDVNLAGWTSVDVRSAIVLDGNGKTISGLTAPLINNASADFEVKNLTVTGANIEVKSANGLDDDTSSAALVQWANGGTLTFNNVSVTNSTIKGDGYVAALVGFVDSTATGVVVNGGTVSDNTIIGGGVVGAVSGLTYADVAVEAVIVSTNSLTSTSDGGTRPDKVGLIVGRPVDDTVSVSATVGTNTATPVGESGPVVIGSLSGGNAVITGGSYDVNPTLTAKAGQTSSVKTGYEIEQNPQGGFGVVKSDPAGQVSRGMYSTSNNRIQGAVSNANPIVSVALELYSGERKIATTSLIKSEYFENAKTELTWSFCITDTSSSWNTVWEAGMPRADLKPDKVVLYIDGTKVAENIVTLHKNNFDMVGEEAVWGDLDGVNPAPAAEINGTPYASLKDAINAAGDGDTITLLDCTHTMPSNVTNKNITITGTENAVVEMLTAITATGSTVNFEGVTVKFDNDNYEGLQHSVKVTYTDCTHIGTQFLYSDTVEFTGCTFEMYNATTEYSVWTYVAKNVTFTECVFNTNGKAILVYNESRTDDFAANLELAECEFNSNGTYTGKAAVELGQSPYGTNEYNLSFTDCTADENFAANNTESNLWGNKNSITTATGSSVVVDSVEQMPDPVVESNGKKYLTVQEAINKGNGEVTLIVDVAEAGIKVEAGKTVVLDLGGFTLTGDIYSEGVLTVKNGTIINNNFVSCIESYGAVANLTLENVTATSTRHALRIEGGEATIISGVYSTLSRGEEQSTHALNAGGKGTTSVTIKGGTFNGIKASELVTTADSGAAVNAQGGATVTIENGNFAGGQNDTLATSDGGKISLTGGTYDEDPSAYLAEGYEAKEADGVWTVVEIERNFVITPDKEIYGTGDEVILTITVEGGSVYGVKFDLKYDINLFAMVGLEYNSGTISFDNSGSGTKEAIADGGLVTTYKFEYIGKGEATAPFTADFVMENISVTAVPVASGTATVVDNVTGTVNLMGIFDDTYVTGADSVDYCGDYVDSAIVSDNLPEGAVVTYTVDGEETTDIPAFINAGEYIVSYTIICENYEYYQGFYEFTINKLAVTITHTDDSKPFGGTDPDSFTGTVTYTGTEDAIPEALLNELGVTYSREAGEAAGTYKIIATVANDANFTVTKNEGTFTIEAAELTLVTILNYADDKTLYLVCTNNNAAVKFGAYQLYEMEDIKSAEAYADVAEYEHVYGWVGLDDTVLAAEDFTAVAYANVETITHDTDINSNGVTDFADRVCVGAVYNGNSAYFKAEYMHILLGADFDMNGRVEAVDAPSL